MRDRPAPRWRRGVPFSRLRGRRFVGAGYYQREGLLTNTSPSGLVDRLEDLGHPGWDPASAAPAIRAFYEQTADHHLVVRPAWRRGFRRGGRIWAAIARRVGQLGLPVVAEQGDERIVSKIVGLDAARDGRPGVRGWVRTYPDGRALYVAAYATHEEEGARYMNIAFPLPGGHMTSILRVEPQPDGGLNVSTIRAGAASDCGIYFVFLGVPIRSPFAEEIVVRMDGDRVVARHDVWVFGVRFVTLDYAITS